MAVSRRQLIRQLTKAGYTFRKPPTTYSTDTLRRRATEVASGKRTGRLAYVPPWERAERRQLTNELLRRGYRFNKPSNSYSLETLRRRANETRKRRPARRRKAERPGFTAEDWREVSYGQYHRLYSNFLYPNRNQPWVGFIVALVKGLASDTRPGVELGWVTVTPFATMRLLARDYPDIAAIHRRNKSWSGSPVGWGLRYRRRDA